MPTVDSTATQSKIGSQLKQGNRKLIRFWHRRSHKIKYMLLFLDILSIQVALLLGIVIANKFSFSFGQYPTLTSIFLFVIVFLFYESRQYKLDQIRKVRDQIRASLLGFFIGGLLCFFVPMALDKHSFQQSTVFALAFFFSGFTLNISQRLFIRRLWRKGALHWLSRSERALAIGVGRMGFQFAAHHPNEHLGITLVGFVRGLGDNPPVDTVVGIPVLGDLEEISFLIDKHKIKQLFITIDDVEYSYLINLVEKLKLLDVIVSVVGDSFSAVTKYMERSEHPGFPVVYLRYGEPTTFEQFVKRLFDIIFSIIMLLILSPFFLLIAVMIKLTSPGKVFYLNPVVGYKGKPFKMIKFRTMTEGNNKQDHKEWTKQLVDNGDMPYKKLAGDKRITAIGRILRKFSIDEFPQLINVIKGDMSLIGPRPPIEYEFQNYKEWHKKKTLIRPGITGLHQVVGRGHSTFNDMITLDLYYIHNYSFLLDIRIFFATILVMILGKGGE